MNGHGQTRRFDIPEHVRARIAEIVAQREVIKRAIGTGELHGSRGLRELESLDSELSMLDTTLVMLEKRVPSPDSI